LYEYSGEVKALLPLQRITMQLLCGPDPANIAYNMFCFVSTMENLLWLQKEIKVCVGGEGGEIVALY
jgi:hypothetical protein